LRKGRKPINKSTTRRRGRPKTEKTYLLHWVGKKKDIVSWERRQRLKNNILVNWERKEKKRSIPTS